MVVPAAIPVITPLLLPIVPTAVLLLLHAPPAVASDKGVVPPTDTEVVPIIAAGVGNTNTTTLPLIADLQAVVLLVANTV